MSAKIEFIIFGGSYRQQINAPLVELLQELVRETETNLRLFV